MRLGGGGVRGLTCFGTYAHTDLLRSSGAELGLDHPSELSCLEGRGFCVPSSGLYTPSKTSHWWADVGEELTLTEENSQLPVQESRVGSGSTP